MWDKRGVEKVFYPSLEGASGHGCATKMVPSDTWKTINKTVACCFLLRRIVEAAGGQVKEMQAHPWNLTHAHAYTHAHTGKEQQICRDTMEGDHKSSRRRQGRYYSTRSVSINSSVPKPWEVVSLFKQVLTHPHRHTHTHTHTHTLIYDDTI